MMRRLIFFVFIFKFLLSFDAIAQPRRILADAGPSGRIVAVPQPRGDEALRLLRRGETVWSAGAQRFEPFRDGASVPIGGGATAIGVTGWTGGAYCCWTLHLFHRGPQGFAHVGSLPLGKREPGVVRLGPSGGPDILLVDAAFDFWEVPASLATDLHPTIPLRWTGRALEPDRDAMRRPLAQALGTACADMAAPDDLPPPERRIATYPDLPVAIAALRAGDWSPRRSGNDRHPGVEAARLAVCLVYAGHAEAARHLLREAWPAGVLGLAETERQISARLACSPFVAAVRAVNAPGAPFLGARCRRDGPDMTAVFALAWR